MSFARPELITEPEMAVKIAGLERDMRRLNETVATILMVFFALIFVCGVLLVPGLLVINEVGTPRLIGTICLIGLIVGPTGFFITIKLSTK